MEDRTARDCNRVEFTITSDAYVGTESYGFEITREVIIVAAKNKSIYVGDTVPDLTNPTVGTDYTVTGLCGTGDKPENSDNTTTITNKDGSTTTTKTDADGNVTSVTAKSVIDNIAKNTTATVTVTVKTDGDGNVTSANASVTKTSDSSKASLSGKVLGQITEAAGADTEVRVTMTVKDSEGNAKYKVQADTNEIIPGEKLYIYKLDTKTGKYTMVNAKEYKVSKAGTVTVNMTKKATYELVTAKESKAITKEILATVKAVVILKNGTKKTVKMTIKVK